MTPSGTLRLVLLAISAASLLLVRAPATHAAEPSAKDLAAEALGAWDVLARNVELGTVRKKKVNGQQVLAGTATVFGHRVTLEGALAGASLRELSLAFSDKKQLTTDALAQLAGQDVQALLPTGLGGHLNVERLRVELQGKRVVGIEVAFQAGVAWRPFGEGALDVSGLRVSVGVVDPTGRRELVINLSGHTTLPDRLGRYLGLPGIQLAMMGAIETRPRRLWLRVDLSSAGTIPLGDQTVVGLEGAHLELVVNERGPTLTLGGTVGLRPASGGPLKLKGTVAINLTGEVYAQAWADGIWSNPLGASDKVHVIEPGLGFGVDFSAVPWPMPIVGLSGGVAIGADPARPDFGGSVVIGLHGGDPTQNMIDATLDRLNAADLIRPFAGHVPSDVTDTLQGIAITEGRLTIVPPGPGVRLFGAWYEPGFLIRGKMTALGTSGELLVDVDPLGVEAHAALSPIALPGLTITGADPGTGPSFYLFAKQNTVAMALSGALEVMGIRRAADIYFSDAGFSATVSGRIADRFDATLDVAGRSPLAGGAGLWVSGTMSGDFVGALVGHVTEQVNAKTRAARSAMASARADLERDKSRLVAIERQVGEARARVRAEKQAECDRFRVGDADRRKKQADKDRLDGRVATLEREIAELDRLIAGAKAHATRKKKTINPLDCRSGQVWDPIHGGGCYECPSGYSRDVTVHIERLGACSKSTASWEASRGVKVADLGATRADRDVVQRALAAMARGATDAGQAACRAANDVAMLDQVPAVKRLLEDKLSVARAVEAAQALLQGGEVVVGAFGATAAWLAARGGEAAGIIKVNEARFEGCLDQTANGTLAMRIRGTFADRPFDGAFDLRLSAPEGGFTQLADHLFAYGKLPPSKGNGRCTRPTVPRPKLGDLQANRRLADRMRGKKTTGAAAPPKRPAWAGPATRPGASPSRPGTAASPAGTATRPAGTAASRPGTAASPTGTAASPAGTAASRPGTAASTPSTPPPAVNPTRQCVQLTQGRIVWDHGANSQWDPRSLQELCDGTRDGRQPPACFTEIMSGRVSWGGGSRWQWKNAVALCGGTSDARETVSCFSRELAGGATWQAALAACRAR